MRPHDEMMASSASPLRPLLTFRPDIEGLRAVAVALVLILHFGVTAVSGGYVGVDVFFVISGFLITSLLIDELRFTERVSIVGFYGRRARRILPVACFVIATTVVLAYLQLGVLIGRTTAVDGQWAAVFAANFRFISQGTDYFASGQPPSALQHYWSLAVEEQFYLVWPTILFGLVALGRRFARSTLALRLGVIAIFAASLAWSVHLSRQQPTTAYFSPFTRAWELAAGALIAVFSVAIANTPAVVRRVAAWTGLAMIAIAALTYSATTVFPGYAALLPVGGAALVIAGGIGQPARSAGTVLSLQPLRRIGLISFSLYLWHWPVLVIAEERSPAPLTNLARVVCVLITIALSVASFRLIEQPLRSGRLIRAKNPRTNWEKSRRALALGAVVIFSAVAVSVFTENRATFAINRAFRAATVDLTSLETDPSLSAEDQVAALEPQVRAYVQQGLTLKRVPPDVDPPVLKLHLEARFTRCVQRRPDVTVKPCVFGLKTSKRTLVVFGDSHAMTWMPALDTYGRQAGYRVVTLYKIACAIPSIDIADRNGPYPTCAAWRTNALRYMRDIKPAVIVTAFNRLSSPFDAHWLSGLQTTLRVLKGTGAHVVQIGRNALLPEDPQVCLSRRNADPRSCTGDFPAHREDVAERAVVLAAGATFIAVEPWYCVNGRCPAIINKRIAYRDHDHLSPEYVSYLEPLLAATLRAAGLR